MPRQRMTDEERKEKQRIRNAARDHRKVYEARVRKAKSESFTGYAAKRRKLERERTIVTGTQLPEGFEDAVVYQEPLTEYQQQAIDRLSEYGVNARTIEELEELRGPDFWKQARPLLERESELARA